MKEIELELRRSIENGLKQLLDSGMSEADAVEALKKIIENAIVNRHRASFRSVEGGRQD